LPQYLPLQVELSEVQAQERQQLLRQLVGLKQQIQVRDMLLVACPMTATLTAV
jgi:hypothetical protein